MKNQNGQARLPALERPPAKTGTVGQGSDCGQALITLLFFTIVSITIISTVAIVTLVQAKSTNIQALSEVTYFYAEDGAEEALIRLLRDPAYTGGNLSIDQAVITIQVTGSSQKAITSSASYFGIKRAVQVDVDYSNNILRVLSWKEVL